MQIGPEYTSLTTILSVPVNTSSTCVSRLIPRQNGHYPHLSRPRGKAGAVTILPIILKAFCHLAATGRYYFEIEF